MIVVYLIFCTLINMDTKSIIKSSLIHSLLVVVYVSIIAQIMFHGEQIFGKGDSTLSTIAFLLLFTTSAAVVGSLVVGKSIMLYIEGHKKPALMMLISKIIWLTIIILCIIAYLALTRKY